MPRLREWQEQSRRIAKSKAQKKRLQAYSKAVRYGTIGTVLLLVVVGGGVLSGTHLIDDAVDSMADWGYGLTADAGFRLENMPVHGRHRTPKQSLLEAIGMQRGAPLLQPDLDDMKERIEALSTVRRVVITRQLPHTLRIQLEERVPAAVWQYLGIKRVVDQDGMLLVSERAVHYPGLPVIVGDGAPEQFRSLMGILQHAPELMPRVRAAVWVGGRRWNIMLEGRNTVMLPEEMPERAWRKLAKMQQAWNLLQPRLKSVDLRVKGRVFLKMTPQTPQSPSPNKASAKPGAV